MTMINICPKWQRTMQTPETVTHFPPLPLPARIVITVIEHDALLAVAKAARANLAQSYGEERRC